MLGIMLGPSDTLMDNPNYVASVFEDWPLYLLSISMSQVIHKQLKTLNVFYLIVSVGREFRNILAGWFRLRFLQEIEAKMLAENVVI